MNIALDGMNKRLTSSFGHRKHQSPKICQIPLSFRLSNDKLLWHFTTNGYFTFKSAYFVALELQRRKVASSSSLNSSEQIEVDPKNFLSLLWRLKIPQKGVVWLLSSLGLRPQLSKACNFAGWALEMYEWTDEERLTKFLVTAWAIWKSQNGLIFKGDKKDPMYTALFASSFLQDYVEAQEKLEVSEIKHPVRWSSPMECCYKINVDSATFLEAEASGIGIIIMNHKGEVMAAMSKRISIHYSAKVVEAMAAREGLNFARVLGFQHVLLEGDSIQVIKTSVSKELDLPVVGAVTEDVKVLMCHFKECTFSFVKRDGNKVTHSLAQYARNVTDFTGWLEESPDFIKSQVVVNIV
ncbi:hypothetical protein HHK36_015783 [Tetracentron sinense]|uniref:RNase H type-1 domain-containing protein n=1 Tax=Tetracentron sinense TaxID=13715 RepID=A0A835DDZ5_TETSI|nr:hypothetical protein HHK36_015783 [Tetracentron sinense]